MAWLASAMSSQERLGLPTESAHPLPVIAVSINNIGSIHDRCTKHHIAHKVFAFELNVSTSS